MCPSDKKMNSDSHDKNINQEVVTTPEPDKISETSITTVLNHDENKSKPEDTLATVIDFKKPTVDKDFLSKVQEKIKVSGFSSVLKSSVEKQKTRIETVTSSDCKSSTSEENEKYIQEKIDQNFKLKKDFQPSAFFSEDLNKFLTKECYNDSDLSVNMDLNVTKKNEVKSDTNWKILSTTLRSDKPAYCSKKPKTLAEKRRMLQGEYRITQRKKVEEEVSKVLETTGNILKVKAVKSSSDVDEASTSKKKLIKKTPKITDKVNKKEGLKEPSCSDNMKKCSLNKTSPKKKKTSISKQKTSPDEEKPCIVPLPKLLSQNTVNCLDQSSSLKSSKSLGAGMLVYVGLGRNLYDEQYRNLRMNESSETEVSEGWAKFAAAAVQEIKNVAVVTRILAPLKCSVLQNLLFEYDKCKKKEVTYQSLLNDFIVESSKKILMEKSTDEQLLTDANLKEDKKASHDKDNKFPPQIQKKKSNQRESTSPPCLKPEINSANNTVSLEYDSPPNLRPEYEPSSGSNSAIEESSEMYTSNKTKNRRSRNNVGRFSRIDDADDSNDNKSKHTVDSARKTTSGKKRMKSKSDLRNNSFNILKSALEGELSAEKCKHGKNEEERDSEKHDNDITEVNSMIEKKCENSSKGENEYSGDESSDSSSSPRKINIKKVQLELKRLNATFIRSSKDKEGEQTGQNICTSNNGESSDLESTKDIKSYKMKRPYVLAKEEASYHQTVLTADDKMIFISPFGGKSKRERRAPPRYSEEVVWPEELYSSKKIHSTCTSTLPSKEVEKLSKPELSDDDHCCMEENCSEDCPFKCSTCSLCFDCELCHIDPTYKDMVTSEQCVGLPKICRSNEDINAPNEKHRSNDLDIKAPNISAGKKLNKENILEAFENCLESFGRGKRVDTESDDSSKYEIKKCSVILNKLDLPKYGTFRVRDDVIEIVNEEDEREMNREEETPVISCQIENVKSISAEEFHENFYQTMELSLSNSGDDQQEIIEQSTLTTSIHRDVGVVSSRNLEWPVKWYTILLSHGSFTHLVYFNNNGRAAISYAQILNSLLLNLQNKSARIVFPNMTMMLPNNQKVEFGVYIPPKTPNVVFVGPYSKNAKKPNLEAYYDDQAVKTGGITKSLNLCVAKKVPFLNPLDTMRMIRSKERCRFILAQWAECIGKDMDILNLFSVKDKADSRSGDITVPYYVMPLNRSPFDYMFHDPDFIKHPVSKGVPLSLLDPSVANKSSLDPLTTLSLSKRSSPNKTSVSALPEKGTSELTNASNTLLDALNTFSLSKSSVSASLKKGTSDLSIPPTTSPSLQASEVSLPLPTSNESSSSPTPIATTLSSSPSKESCISAALPAPVDNKSSSSSPQKNDTTALKPQAIRVRSDLLPPVSKEVKISGDKIILDVGRESSNSLQIVNNDERTSSDNKEPVDQRVEKSSPFELGKNFLASFTLREGDKRPDFVPYMAYLCTTPNVGYLPIMKFTARNFTLKDPRYRYKRFLKFVNPEEASTWLNEYRYKKFLRFVTPQEASTWLNKNFLNLKRPGTEVVKQHRWIIVEGIDLIKKLQPFNVEILLKNQGSQKRTSLLRSVTNEEKEAGVPAKKSKIESQSEKEDLRRVSEPVKKSLDGELTNSGNAGESEQEKNTSYELIRSLLNSNNVSVITCSGSTTTASTIVSKPVSQSTNSPDFCRLLPSTTTQATSVNTIKNVVPNSDVQIVKIKQEPETVKGNIAGPLVYVTKGGSSLQRMIEPVPPNLLKHMKKNVGNIGPFANLLKPKFIPIIPNRPIGQTNKYVLVNKLPTGNLTPVNLKPVGPASSANAAAPVKANVKFISVYGTGSAKPNAEGSSTSSVAPNNILQNVIQVAPKNLNVSTSGQQGTNQHTFKLVKFVDNVPVVSGANLKKINPSSLVFKVDKPDSSLKSPENKDTALKPQLNYLKVGVSGKNKTALQGNDIIIEPIENSTGKSIRLTKSYSVLSKNTVLLQQGKINSSQLNKGSGLFSSDNFIKTVSTKSSDDNIELIRLDPDDKNKEGNRIIQTSKENSSKSVDDDVILIKDFVDISPVLVNTSNRCEQPTESDELMIIEDEEGDVKIIPAHENAKRNKSQSVISAPIVRKDPKERQFPHLPDITIECMTGKMEAEPMTKDCDKEPVKQKEAAKQVVPANQKEPTEQEPAKEEEPTEQEPKKQKEPTEQEPPKQETVEMLSNTEINREKVKKKKSKKKKKKFKKFESLLKSARRKRKHSEPLIIELGEKKKRKLGDFSSESSDFSSDNDSDA